METPTITCTGARNRAVNLVFTAVTTIGMVGAFLFAAVSPAGASGATNQYDLSQCANGGKGTLAACAGSAYQHGDLNGSNSHWAEGDFVPFQLVLTGITHGSHTVALQYETVSGGKHAYDYLGSFDATETTSGATPAHANGNDPCSSIISGCALSSPLTAPIPVPDLSKVNPTCNSAGTPPTLPSSPGVMSMWGPTGTTLGPVAYESPMNQPVQAGKTVSDCHTLIDVTFVSPADGSTMVLAWSGHVASDLDWGASTGAGSINGAPYHMWVENLDGSGGAQQRSMQVSGSQPTLTTVIEGASGTPVAAVVVGTPVHDTATLTGASATAGGTVTYQVFDNGTCTSPAATTYSAVTVANGIVPDSPSFTPTQAGIYSYLATYTGDPTDSPATGACEGPLTVTAVPAPVVKVVKSETTPGAGQTVTAGQAAPITYKLAATNVGTADATNFVVTDVVPAGTTYVAGSATPATDAAYNSTTKTITWTIPTLVAASNGTPGEVDLTFRAMVDSADANGSTIVNQAVFADLNTPSCVAGTAANTCLTNQVSNPVVTAPVVQSGTPTPQVPPPDTTIAPAAPADPTVAAQELAFTGSWSLAITALGAALIACGGAVLALSRRRRPSGIR